jgi:hypothetical protein
MKEKLLSLIKSINLPNMSKGAMRYIVWYALLLVFCCMLYVLGWCIDWYDMGKPNLFELRSFLHEIASASWVAVIGFIAKAFVDKDNDGIPDEFEEESNNTTRNKNF